MRWHVGQDNKTGDWRVIDENNRVICRGLVDKDDAERIAHNHNSFDPIKSWHDWLYHKDKMNVETAKRKLGMRRNPPA
jgi:hypothetical protein